MALTKTAHWLLELPRPLKRGLALAFDVSLCVLTVWFAFWLRLDEWVRWGHPQWRPEWATLLAIVLALPIYIVSGFYRAVFRYAGWQATLTVARAMVFYGILYATIITAIGLPGVPRTVGIIQPLLLFFATAASRLLLRFWLGGLYHHVLARNAKPKALIYGAGEAGAQLAASMATSPELAVVGFVDDDPRLVGQTLNGLPIHAATDLPLLVQSQDISQVLIAIPSANRRKRNEILRRLEHLHVRVRLLPSLADLVHGRVTVSDLVEPDIDDLLGRDPVPLDSDRIAAGIRDKTILVTGAGGSIGSELARQIARHQPCRLLLVEHSEYALYSIHRELCALLEEDRLVPLLVSVTDETRLRRIFSTFRPHAVYHAAAYKHVPLVEHNVVAGLVNNVFGTLVAARLAREAGTERFVLISTDKAVRPTNVMGASKRLAEMVLQALAAEEGNTRFAMVRFGNVLDSSGSVVPLFRQQIRAGGPVTVTHPEVTRYFMTIPEAVGLVLQAAALGEGGEVFLLDMGEPVKIVDLARRMIELAGLSVRSEEEPEGDIEIRFIGLRPGEKLYEELLIGENPEPTSHPRIFKAHEDFLPWPQLALRLASLEAALARYDIDAIRTELTALVAGYAPAEKTVDWLAAESSANGACLQCASSQSSPTPTSTTSGTAS